MLDGQDITAPTAVPEAPPAAAPEGSVESDIAKMLTTAPPRTQLTSKAQNLLTRLLYVRNEVATLNRDLDDAMVGARGRADKTAAALGEAGRVESVEGFFPALERLVDDLERLISPHRRHVVELVGLFGTPRPAALPPTKAVAGERGPTALMT